MSKLLIFAHFLFFGERCEWIAHFAQIKWAMWGNRSFRLLTKIERPWAIRSGRSEEMSDVSQLLISLTKNERMSESLIFWQKTSDSLEIKWANSQPR